MKKGGRTYNHGGKLKNKGGVTQFWDLSSPKMCRDFLKNVRMGDPNNPSRITYFQTVSGDQISIDEASDEQVLEVAKQIAEAVERRK